MLALISYKLYKNSQKVLQLQHFFGIIKCVEKYTHIVSIKRVLVYTSFFMWLKQYGGKTKRRKEKWQ
jgi:hypothetical protein